MTSSNLSNSFSLLSNIRALSIILFFSAICAAGPFAGAQDNAGTADSLSPPVKQIEFVGDTISSLDALFIGEIHALFEGVPFEFDMIRWAHKKFGISDVVMEIGKSEAYQFNAYLQHGDTTIFTYYGRGKKIMEFLQKYQDLYDECKITIHGFDFERSTYVTAVLSILNKSEPAKSTELYKYLSTLFSTIGDMDDKKSGRKENIKKFSKAQNIFQAEKEKLKSILPTGFPTIEEIFENPATEKNFKNRDNAMALNLTNLKKTGNGFICIAGIGHTTFNENTVLKQYVAGNPSSKTALISMVCKNCYTSSYFGSSVIPIVADYEGKNEKYMTAAFDNFYKPGFYSVINQHEFKDLPGGYNEIPTYFVLFKDQPKW